LRHHITALGGDPVKSVAELRSAIAKRKAGEKVNVEINRNKKRSAVSLTLGKMPEE
jgi:S1-C subfamily serine protease